MVNDPVANAKRLRIEIGGELAGILELCDVGANQRSGSLWTAGLAEQIKMVAGTCNYLDFLLTTGGQQLGRRAA